MDSLSKSLNCLVYEKHMLSGMSVAFGNAKNHAVYIVGNKSEGHETQGQYSSDKKPLNEGAVFDLASLTKLFTAVSVFMLLEKRKIRMTDCIGMLDKRFTRLKDTSLFDVMTYRASLKTPERIDLQPTFEKAEEQVFLTYEDKTPPIKLYSDMNALVLKYVIETVSGQPYDAFLQELVFTPLNMRETWHCVPQNRRSDCLCYHDEYKVINGVYRVTKEPPPGIVHDPKARILSNGNKNLSGHAGLFSTVTDMVRFASGLLSGELLRKEHLLLMGRNQSGYLKPDGSYRQYMGLLCFSKSAVPRLSEVPLWMGEHAFALSGYTGNHIAIDIENGVFDLLLGNRCHNRLSTVIPQEDAEKLGLDDEGVGNVLWPDGRLIASSFQYVYQKDRMIHDPVREELIRRGWMSPPKTTNRMGVF